jgi:energy-converting hydrogenase Eha subunit B
MSAIFTPGHERRTVQRMPYISRSTVDAILRGLDPRTRGRVEETAHVRRRTLSAQEGHALLGNVGKTKIAHAARLFDHGRDGFNTKLLSWTGDTQKALLLDMSVAGTWNKLITGATNASPVVFTSAAHGFSNTDVLVTLSVGGNLSANQTGLATSVATNTFSMTTLEGQTVAGSAAYTSGGYVIDLTQATFVADILGNRVGTDPTIAGTTSSRGVANATSPITWVTVPAGNAAQAVVFYDAAGGSDATDRLIAWQDGKVRVITVGDQPISSTTLKVQPIRAQIWDGATGAAPVLWFSNGFSATLNAAAAQGADTLTVTATGHDIPDLQTADVFVFGGGLPLTPSGGNVSFSIGTILAPLSPVGIYQL